MSAAAAQSRCLTRRCGPRNNVLYEHRGVELQLELHTEDQRPGLLYQMVLRSLLIPDRTPPALRGNAAVLRATSAAQTAAPASRQVTSSTYCRYMTRASLESCLSLSPLTGLAGLRVHSQFGVEDSDILLCQPDSRFSKKFSFFPLPGIVMCNKTVGCPDQYTCCKTKDGDWACCPLPNVRLVVI